MPFDSIVDAVLSSTVLCQQAKDRKPHKQPPSTHTHNAPQHPLPHPRGLAFRVSSSSQSTFVPKLRSSGSHRPSGASAFFIQATIISTATGRTAAAAAAGGAPRSPSQRCGVFRASIPAAQAAQGKREHEQTELLHVVHGGGKRRGIGAKWCTTIIVFTEHCPSQHEHGNGDDYLQMAMTRGATVVREKSTVGTEGGGRREYPGREESREDHNAALSFTMCQRRGGCYSLDEGEGGLSALRTHERQ